MLFITTTPSVVAATFDLIFIQQSFPNGEVQMQDQILVRSISQKKREEKVV